jgi:hypothetical protein
VPGEKRYNLPQNEKDTATIPVKNYANTLMTFINTRKAPWASLLLTSSLARARPTDLPVQLVQWGAFLKRQLVDG